MFNCSNRPESLIAGLIIIIIIISSIERKHQFSRYPSVMTMSDGNILIVGGSQQVKFVALLYIMPSCIPNPLQGSIDQPHEQSTSWPTMFGTHPPFGSGRRRLECVRRCHLAIRGFRDHHAVRHVRAKWWRWPRRCVRFFNLQL